MKTCTLSDRKINRSLRMHCFYLRKHIVILLTIFFKLKSNNFINWTTEYFHAFYILTSFKVLFLMFFIQAVA